MGSDVNKFYFRLVLLGSDGTGFLFSKFEPKHKPTVEDLFTKTFHLGSLEIKVDFLDTSGSMQFPAMRRLSITNGDAFLIVYSVDDESSLQVLKMCIGEIQEARPKDYQEIPIVFAGNKCELARDERKVTKELVSNYVYYELPRLRAKVVECSCKENLNIETIFRAYLSLARVAVATPPTTVLASPAASGSTSIFGGVSRRSKTLGSGGGGGGSNSNVSAGGTGSGKRRPASAVPADDLTQDNARSFKLALGVRKSCDASITSSLRKVSLSSARSSREHLQSARETSSNSSNSNDCQQRKNAEEKKKHDGAEGEGEGENDEHDEDDRPSGLEACQQKSSIESILKAAAQQSQNQRHPNHGHAASTKLQVAYEAKPRSKSLIWRPTRKTSRSSSGEQSECRVS